MTPLKLITSDMLGGLPHKPFAMIRPDADDLDRELVRLEIPAVARRKLLGLNAAKARGLERSP